MRRALLAAVAVAALALPGAALEVPFLSGRVNDDAHLLDAGAARSLEAKLKAYEARTGRQFAVLTIPSLQGAVLEEFSLEVARTWGLGRKDKDDGILLLVSRDDRKLRIEVGYGLEGVLPDALCGRIIRDAIVPRFRRGDYAGGVTAGADEVLAALSGEASSPSSPRFGVRPGHLPMTWNSAVVALLFLWMLIQSALQIVLGSAPAGAMLHFVLMNMFVSLYAMDWFGFGAGAALFVANPVILAVLGWKISNTDWGRELSKKAKSKGTTLYWLSSGSGGGSSGGGFSGGGGSFGGGGSSGSW